MTGPKLCLRFAFVLSVSLVAITTALEGHGEDTPDLNALSNADLGTLTIHLERTHCFGTCPAYALTIHGDGKVEYDGKSYVKETGMHEGHLAKDAVESLVAEFAKAQFWKMDEDYSQAENCKGFCTDMATVITELDVKGVTHRVKHYYGCGGVSRLLFDLESAIDTAANSEQWTGDVSKAGPFGTSCSGGRPGPTPKREP